MNEVSISKAASTYAAAGASSKGAVEARPQAQAQSGKSLPDQNVKAEPAKESKAPEEVQKELETEVATVNEFVQSIQRDLQFTLDKELDKTVIKVVDSDSGELIRQIPEDIFLELARKLKDGGEFRLVSSIG